MAVGWYLMHSAPVQLGGYEQETVDDYYADGFAEVLDTSMAVDVEIYNYDLSEMTPARAVIQNRTPDTKLQTVTRQMMLPIGIAHAGMYAKYDGRYWLITGVVDNNGIYDKAVLSLCNYLLTWIGGSGRVVQRWAYIVSASQYNNGETNMKFYFVRSDQLLVMLPNDDESVTVADGQRFVIDARCKVYEKSIPEDAEKRVGLPLTTYKLTRYDSVLYEYVDSGCMEFMVSEDEQKELDGFYRVDGKGCWLCVDGGAAPSADARVSRIEIESDVRAIYNNIEPTVFHAAFRDADGNPVGGIDPVWGVSCGFSDRLEVALNDDWISIGAHDESLVGKSVTLSLSAAGYGTESIEVPIKALF